MTLEVRPTADEDFAVVTVAPFVLGRFPTEALAEAFRATLAMRRAHACEQTPFDHGPTQARALSPTDVGTAEELEWTEELERELVEGDLQVARRLSAILGLPVSILAYHRDQLIAQAAAGETA